MQIAAGPDVQLEVRRRAALALILHELATKAAKYGAFAVPDGRLRVDWSEDGQGGLPRLRLRRGESGLVDASRTDHEGLGTKLVRRSTQHDLGGTALRNVGPDRLKWELKMRLA